VSKKYSRIPFGKIKSRMFLSTVDPIVFFQQRKKLFIFSPTFPLDPNLQFTICRMVKMAKWLVGL
ncbi:MAG TPA: hypothetical protein VFG54_01345, partial [Prolixibacteraceae bacterium]|nr:hypothetical protein [Prolixibacteraceae bacterium]